MSRLHIFILGLYVIGFFLSVPATFCFLFMHVVVIPIIFYFSKRARQFVIFPNKVHNNKTENLEEPRLFKIEGARNVYLEFESKVDSQKVKLGLWHILGRKDILHEKGLSDTFSTSDEITISRVMDDYMCKSGSVIIIYFHGNSGDRATGHRVDLYKCLQNMNYHIITFDYRGYGDSTNLHPSEDGVVEDALLVYEWVLNIIQKNRNHVNVFVWGHSLGTGVAAKLIGNLEELSSRFLNRDNLFLPLGLILEAPFTSMRDAILNYPLTKFFTFLPYFEVTIGNPLCNQFQFESYKYLSTMPALPILILHSKDDIIVPFALGSKLYEDLRGSRNGTSGELEFHPYERSEKLGHDNMCHGHNFVDNVSNFVSKCLVRT